MIELKHRVRKFIIYISLIKSRIINANNNFITSTGNIIILFDINFDIISITLRITEISTFNDILSSIFITFHYIIFNFLIFSNTILLQVKCRTKHEDSSDNDDDHIDHRIQYTLLENN